MPERLEIAILFASVCIGYAAGANFGFISDDPLTTLLVSVAAIVISYSILNYAVTFFVSRRNG